jgi:hypothetical protein
MINGIKQTVRRITNNPPTNGITRKNGNAGRNSNAGRSFKPVKNTMGAVKNTMGAVKNTMGKMFKPSTNGKTNTNVITRKNGNAKSTSGLSETQKEELNKRKQTLIEEIKNIKKNSNEQITQIENEIKEIDKQLNKGGFFSFLF